MRNFFFLTSRNRRRAARVRVSRCLGAEIRQAGRHVRASGGKRRGGLKKLLPEIRKLARHPVHSSRSNVRVSLNVEKKNSKKRGKKERNEDGDKKGRGKKKKKFPSRYSIDKEFFSLSFTRNTCTRSRDTRIFFSMRTEERGGIYVCGRGVRHDLRERNEKKGE